MRFRNKYSLKDREGEYRVRRKFLLWPRTFTSGHKGLQNETRWWEKTDIVERVIRMDVGGSGEWGNYAWKWCEVGFADDCAVIPHGCAFAVDER